MVAGYHQVEVRSHTESTVQAGNGITAVSDSELNELLLTASYSGSGSGVPVLVQRSVARQVCLATFHSVEIQEFFYHSILCFINSNMTEKFQSKSGQ